MLWRKACLKEMGVVEKGLPQGSGCCGERHATRKWVLWRKACLKEMGVVEKGLPQGVEDGTCHKEVSVVCLVCTLQWSHYSGTLLRTEINVLVYFC